MSREGKKRVRQARQYWGDESPGCHNVESPAPTRPMKLEPFVPAEIDLGGGRGIQVCWDEDQRQLIIMGHGPHLTGLHVLPRSGNAIAVVAMRGKEQL